MKSTLGMIAAACAVLAGSNAFAAPDSAAVKETVRAIFKAANANDVARLTALQMPAASVIDEFAPFHWDSFNDWGAAYGAYNTANGVAHPKTTLLKFSHVNVEGDRAYVVTTVAYTYTEGGKARKENGTEVIALEKQTDGWRAASFAWLSKAGVDQGDDALSIVDAVHHFTSMAGAPSPAPTAIVDEFAPYHWTGATANADWFAGLQKGMAQDHTTDVALALSAPDQLSVNSNKAYAVFPTIITDKRNGKTEAEHGKFAFALEKADGAWHIASWAWATK
jgi:ketosteroid isomerase-like protein